MVKSTRYEERLLDPSNLREYLQEALGGDVDRFEVERLQAGHSNETLFVTWGDRRLVLRRPPAGETADKAHDVLREYKVMDALQGTDVPVPVTVLACDDTSVIGSEFFLMERLDGQVIRKEEPEDFGNPSTRRRLSERFVDALSSIHDLDYESVGLGDFGKPEGFTKRQVDTWTKQIEWATQYTESERGIPAAFEVGEWLSENLPETHPHTLVHGDYKLDNVMYSPPPDPEVIGVFDWEMSTLGDPLTDLGWMLSTWYDPGDPEPVIPEFYRKFTGREGYLRRREFVNRYERQTGLSFDHPRFYVVLGMYKLVGITEMFFARYLKDGADDPIYPAMRDRVPALARRTLEIAEAPESELTLLAGDR